MKYTAKIDKNGKWFVYDPQGQKTEGEYENEDSAKSAARFMNGE